MSGIAGVWTPGAPRARGLLKIMAPESACGFTSAELAVATLAPAAGLVAHRAGGAVVVADARLDDSADEDAAEIVLAAFERHRDACAATLAGDFAFAAFDPTRGELVLARDAMGAKPLYYAKLGDAVAFSSTLGTLLALPGISHAPDERALVDYLGGFPEDEQRTTFAAIHRVLPASSLMITRDQVRAREYWRPDPTRELGLGSDGEYAEALRSALERAVHRRLPAQGRCAVLLSGGLDSSSVACVAELALQHKNQHLITVSASFDEARECDERAYQATIVEHAATDHADVPMERELSGTDLRESLELFVEPNPVGDHWMAWPLLEAAAARGARVVFTGVDGDRVVSHGLGQIEELAHGGRWRELWFEVRARGLGRARAARAVAGQALATQLPSAWVTALDQLRRQAEQAYQPALGLLHPEVLARGDVRERLGAAHRRPVSARDAHATALTRADRTSDLDMFHPLGRRFGVEVRHPFFDRELVELCLCMPADQKIRRGVSRYVLREAMRGIVPELVRTRPGKAFFDSGFEAWAERVLSIGRNRNAINLENLAPYLDVTALRKSLGGPVRALPMDLVWRCVVVSAWLEGLARGWTHAER